MTSIMTPAEIVSELDKFIIGQRKAKKSVAIALRNRWRRQQVSEPMRTEITPKNILMIGPTGVGKTEIARRLAKLANAPFIKVEATKFTEVGYVGKDVDTIIRDLVDISIKNEKQIAVKKKQSNAENIAEDKILDILLPLNDDAEQKNNNATRQMFRKKLRQGELDDKEINIEVNVPLPKMDIIGPPGMEDALEQLKNMFGSGNTRTKTKTFKIKEAFKILTEQEAEKL